MIFHSLLFDKSTFQSLSKDEIFFLRTYYFPVISHILIIEILGDLKKGGTDAGNSDRVKDLSNKILQLNPTYSASYFHLLEMSLMGYPVEMRGRPNVLGGEQVVDPDGKRGIKFSQPPEEQILQRWRDGKFDEAEEISARSWRDSIKDNVIKPDSMPRPEFLNRLKNHDDLLSYIESYLELPHTQDEILQNVLAVFAFPQELATQVFYRYEQVKPVMIADFAPYALYCYRVFMLFQLSIYRGITTPRQTDIVDLQYLYYLPFVSIFTSHDKFHITFAPLFLREDQKFIVGNDLKADLKSIVKLRDEVPEPELDEWMKKQRSFPPEQPDSFTYNVWKEGATPSYKGWTDESHERTPEQEKELLERLKRMKSGGQSTDPSGVFDEEGTEFITRESWIGPEDYCPCGSGKLFKDCHLPEVKKKMTNRRPACQGSRDGI
jgi:hypothetical protein